MGGNCCEYLTRQQWGLGVLLLFVMYHLFSTTAIDPAFLSILVVAVAVIPAILEKTDFHHLAGGQVSSLGLRELFSRGNTRETPVLPSANAHLAWDAADQARMPGTFPLAGAEASAAASASAAAAPTPALTPAQASLHQTPDNPYGNYRLYDDGPMEVYTGAMAAPPDDRLERGAYGTMVLDPGLQYYTQPDSTGIAHMRPPTSTTNYGPAHSPANAGQWPGGLWVGR